MKKSKLTSLEKRVLELDYFPIIIDATVTEYIIWKDLRIQSIITGETISSEVRDLCRRVARLKVNGINRDVDIFDIFVAAFDRDPITSDPIRWASIYLNGTRTHYEISDNGYIRSRATKRLISIQTTDDDYKVVSLLLDGKQYKRSVHRLVALAFIPNPDNKPEVNHKDGKKENNQWWNLEWVTSKENSEHAVRTGLRHGSRGTANGRNIYTDDQIRRACKLLEDPKKLPMTISAETGVSKTMLHNIRFKGAWEHISKDYDLYMGKHKCFNPGRTFTLSAETTAIMVMLKEGKTSAEIKAKLYPDGTDNKFYSKVFKARRYLVTGSTTIEPSGAGLKTAS